MTPTQRKLAARMLELAASQFRHHGCNNYDLVRDGGLTKTEARRIQKALYHDGFLDEPTKGTASLDNLLMEWLSRRLRGDLKPWPAKSSLGYAEGAPSNG